MKKYTDDNLAASHLNEPLVTYRAPSPKATAQVNVLDVIKTSRAGLPYKRVVEIAQLLSLSLIDISSILHLSSRSLQRYGPEKLLPTDTSAVVIRMEVLLKDGLDTFSNEKDFTLWLKSSLPFLNGESPLSYLDTPFGFDLVTQLLGRIRHGIFA